MTKKRLRYSELEAPAPAAPVTPVAPESGEAPAEAPAEPVAPKASAKPKSAKAAKVSKASKTSAAPATPEPPTAVEEKPAEVVAPEAAAAIVAPEPVVETPVASTVVEQPAVPVPKPKRNSTPVELARTLAAERAAQATTGVKPSPVVGRTSGSRQALRTLRDHARARSGIADLLMFRIAGERFAVELLAVDEVIDLPVLHHVPEMPPAMLGVVTVRGSLTPVYSPHQALGLPLAMRDALLIFRRGASRIGVLIDDVEDAISLDLSELRDAPGASDVENVVLGVIRHADSLVGIIDAEALIAACQIAALQEIA